MSYLDLCGHKYLPKEIVRIQGLQPHPTMKIAGAAYGLQAKKETTLLYRNLIQVLGHFLILTQAIGDCVSFGMAGAINVLKATQIVLNASEDWKGPTATEPIYALSRVEVGGRQLAGNDGSCGAWAAQAVKTYGTLVRDIYGKYDLRNYSGQVAKNWGESGLPDELEPTAHEHLVKTVTQVTTVEDAIASITNGYPFTIASNQGFQNVRDKNGFSWPQGAWPHQMYIDSYRTDIEGFLVVNSWGPNWITGPKFPEDQPDGSFWISAEVLENIFSTGDADCWSISSFNGYPPQEINLEIV